MDDNSLNVSDLIENKSLAVSEFPDEFSVTIESVLIENLQKTQQELTILTTKPIQSEPAMPVGKKDDVSFINPTILTQYDAATVQKVQEVANNPASSTKLTNEQKQIIAQFYGF